MNVRVTFILAIIARSKTFHSKLTAKSLGRARCALFRSRWVFFATVEPRDISISTAKIAHSARHFLSTYTQRKAQQHDAAASA